MVVKDLSNITAGGAFIIHSSLLIFIFQPLTYIVPARSDFFLFVCFSAKSGDTQGLLMPMHSEIAPDSKDLMGYRGSNQGPF